VSNTRYMINNRVGIKFCVVLMSSISLVQIHHLHVYQFNQLSLKIALPLLKINW